MSIKLQLKLRDRATPEQRDAAIAAAENAGATAVRPLFPPTDDRELASFFIVDVRDSAIARRVRTLLEKVAGVEFVEGEVKRSRRRS